MVTVKQHGSYAKTEKLLKHASSKSLITRAMLIPYAERGVNRLSSMTPLDTGETKSSWFYKIKIEEGLARIEWHNDNVVDGCNIAIILQYGHATRQGGWVEGRDYINPAMRPVFDALANDIWREVVKT